MAWRMRVHCWLTPMGMSGRPGDLKWRLKLFVATCSQQQLLQETLAIEKLKPAGETVNPSQLPSPIHSDWVMGPVP